ncbi:MAG: IS256 family transposase [Leptolyngbyaceae cyanobacterium RM1_406_9]|nr:IS256 family transposase [Leptolyngbyaceae cyanobacterium RM1_406_9]
MPKKVVSKVDQLLDELIESDHSPEAILGEGGLLKQLSKRLVERVLQSELSHHLAQAESDPQSPPNSRNGYSAKTIQADFGQVEIQVPRDRQSEFEPILVKKGQRRLAGLDEKVIALYGRGLSTRDIQAQLQELYGVELSATLISQVTDGVMEEVRTWQSRPLDKVYPIVWLDALRVKIRLEGRVHNQAVYLILAVNLEGNKELLGLWIAPTEGAKFWLGVLTDLKNRGVEDIFIACVDGLSGFPEAIATVYPQTTVQLCLVHLVRNSLKFVSWKHYKAIVTDLKSIYRATTLTQAEDALTGFAQTWDHLYPMISQIWLRHWEHIIPFFAYPPEIRRVIYTTNAIESLNRCLRKVLKTKGAFPDTDSVVKLLYLALTHIALKWTRPNWKSALARFAIDFPGRVPL